MIKAKFAVSGHQFEHVTAVQIHNSSKDGEALIADYEVEVDEYNEDGSVCGIVILEEDHDKEIFCYLASSGDVFLVDKGQAIPVTIIAPVQSNKAV